MHVHDQRSTVLEQPEKGIHLAFPSREVCERTFRENVPQLLHGHASSGRILLSSRPGFGPGLMAFCLRL